MWVQRYASLGKPPNFFAEMCFQNVKKYEKAVHKSALTGGVPVAACAHRCRRRFTPVVQRPGADVGQLGQTAAYERRPFSLQLTAYCSPIHGLLQRGLPPFGDRVANGLQPDGYDNAACLRHGVPAHRATRRCDDGRECPIRHFHRKQTHPKKRSRTNRRGNSTAACKYLLRV